MKDGHGLLRLSLKKLLFSDFRSGSRELAADDEPKAAYATSAPMEARKAAKATELGHLPHWPDTVRALARLADHLDAVHVPVDYQ
ncbi:hypothetical protein [Streptomyces sp. NPDC006510]|uniref:hypothetical protein n=1 Tax=Streptomyces sp. NPDC006510 TaxID=3155600 RepID=UPI0033A6FBEF